MGLSKYCIIFMSFLVSKLKPLISFSLIADNGYNLEDDEGVHAIQNRLLGPTLGPALHLHALEVDCKFNPFQCTLAMSGEEVRLSELEMGVSSSEDHGTLEVSSPSTPHKAWSICYALKRKDKRRIRNRFQFPSSIKVRIPDDNDRVCHSYTDEVCFYEANFTSGLHFVIHPFIRELFSHLLLVPAQLFTNSWRIVICCIVVQMFANDRYTINIDEFLHFLPPKLIKNPRVLGV